MTVDQGKLHEAVNKRFAKSEETVIEGFADAYEKYVQRPEGGRSTFEARRCATDFEAGMRAAFFIVEALRK